MAESVSKVLSFLFQSDVMELFDAISTSEWASAGQQEDAECEHSLDGSIPYLCGDTRKEPSETLKAILKRSCYGDSHKQGQLEVRKTS